MADNNRGGYQRPSKPASASGPGALSKRTDTGPGDQAVRVPNVTSDNSSLQVGDRQTLEAAQRLAPLPQAQSPRVASPSRKPPSSAVEGGGSIPSGFFDQESARPQEPVTAGLGGPTTDPMGDMREMVLNYLATSYANADALKALDEIRGVMSDSGNVQGLAPNQGSPLVPGGRDIQSDSDVDLDRLADSRDLLAPDLDGDSLAENEQDLDDELAAESAVEDSGGNPTPNPDMEPSEASDAASEETTATLPPEEGTE